MDLSRKILQDRRKGQEKHGRLLNDIVFIHKYYLVYTMVLLDALYIIFIKIYSISWGLNWYLFFHPSIFMDIIRL